MPLFHASRDVFSENQVVTASSPTTYYADAVVALEQQRPACAPSRSVCVFASDNSEFAAFFLLRQQVPSAQIRLYEVEMPTNWRAPFALVHALQRRLEKSQVGSALVAEYWKPVMSWKFWEVFGPEMRINRLVATPRVNEVLLFNSYLAEVDHAGKI
jgi:hypothetical protein